MGREQRKGGYGIRVGHYVFTEAWGTKPPPKPPKSDLTKSQRDKLRYDRLADEINEARRAKRREETIRRELEQAASPKWETVPPCGGDCLQCPYDDACRYADWEEQIAAEKARQNPNRAENDRAKERLKTDPDYRNRRHEYVRKSACKRRWRERGLPLEEFERAYADGTYKAMMEAERHAPRKKAVSTLDTSPGGEP